MIRYCLKCDDGHTFDSWFQNANAFETLQRAGQLSCPECGATKIEKSLMAPKVRPAKSAASMPLAPDAPETTASKPMPVAAPNPELEAELAKLRAKVEADSDYVGTDFATQARAMHLGDTPERSIYGEAKLEDAKELIEDGVPVMPLPFAPTRKIN